MRIKIDSPNLGLALFLTAANQPTQVAYQLCEDDVVDAFIVSLLARPRVLLAASYFFESNATRNLKARYPLIFSASFQRAIFFVNAQYPSFTDHGLAKVEKSPKSFSPYTNSKLVKKRGRELDGLGVVGVRNDLDISDALVEAWRVSCTSNDPESIASLICNRLAPSVVDASIARCIALTNRGPYDFVWQTIEKEISKDNQLSKIEGDLRRKLADLYGQVMSRTLGAVETTPSIATEGKGISQRSVGNLGIFQQILGFIGIDIRQLRDEQPLISLLDADELLLIRRIHETTMQVATESQENILDYWQAIRLAEEGIRKPRLSARQMKQALAKSFRAVGLSPGDPYVKNLVRIEEGYEYRFLRHFKASVEGILAASIVDPGRYSRLPNKSIVDWLLYTSADPKGYDTCDLNTDEEFKDIRRALDDLGDTQALKIHPVPSLKIEELQREVTKLNPRYFHFSGHGNKSGAILVEPGDGPDSAQIGLLVKFVKSLSTELECVVFSSCHSGVAISDIGDRVKYAVLMSKSISDETARRFAVSFYGAVGSGIKVPTAFFIAKDAMQLFKLADSNVPRLYRYGKLIS